MDLSPLGHQSELEWTILPTGKMRVPGTLDATEAMNPSEDRSAIDVVERAPGEIRVEAHRIHTPGSCEQALPREAVVRRLLEKRQRLRS